MTNSEQIRHDMVIALDFAAQIIENPQLLDEIPEDAAVSFLDDENIKRESLLDKKPERKYVKVKRHFEVL